MNIDKEFTTLTARIDAVLCALVSNPNTDFQALWGDDGIRYYDALANLALSLTVAVDDLIEELKEDMV